VHRQENHVHCGPGDFDEPGRLQAIEDGHPDVDDDEIGIVFERQIDNLTTVRARPDYLMVRREQGHDAIQYQGMVVTQNDP